MRNSVNRIEPINNYTGGRGDPFMIILSPISQTKNEATFVAYASRQIRDYYINIITLTSEISNLELDGASIGTNLFTPFPGTDYSYTQIEIYQGNHTLKTLIPTKVFWLMFMVMVVTNLMVMALDLILIWCLIWVTKKTRFHFVTESRLNWMQGHFLIVIYGIPAIQHKKLP